MTTTVEAIYDQGKLYLSGPLSLPDKSRVSVTIESDPERAAWPQKASLEGLVKDTWEKLGPAPDVDYDRL